VERPKCPYLPRPIAHRISAVSHGSHGETAIETSLDTDVDFLIESEELGGGLETEICRVVWRLAQAKEVDSG
jgi:hypothetical protein